MLTIEDLKSYTPNLQFASGQKFLYEASNHENIYLKWVAVRGMIWDWAVYVVEGDLPLLEEWPFDSIASSGNKIHSMSTVKELVSADEEALKMYRH